MQIKMLIITLKIKVIIICILRVQEALSISRHR